MGCKNCPDPMSIPSPIKYLGWRAFYDDGRVFCSREDRWKDLPEDGLLLVMVYNQDSSGNLIRRVIGASIYGLQEQSDGRPPIFIQEETSLEIAKKRWPHAYLKLGRWTDEETWARVDASAMASIWN